MATRATVPSEDLELVGSDSAQLPKLTALPAIEIVRPVTAVQTQTAVPDDFVVLLPMARTLPVDLGTYMEAPYPNYTPYNLFVVRTWLYPVLAQHFAQGSVPELLFTHNVYNGLMRVGLVLNFGDRLVPFANPGLLMQIGQQLEHARSTGYRGVLLPGGQVEDLEQLADQMGEVSYIDVFNSKFTR